MSKKIAEHGFFLPLRFEGLDTDNYAVVLLTRAAVPNLSLL